MTRQTLAPSQCPGKTEGGAADRRFFQLGQELVQDDATGLIWPRSAKVLEFPVTWEESLAAVAEFNRSRFLGSAGWRMPNRRELQSLVCHAEKMPALPVGHPFCDVFLGWYWTSTSKAGNPAYAWNIHFEGGRMFYSRKDEFRLLWPVRGESELLPQTGQRVCYDGVGNAMPCTGTGQDGELQRGAPWPSPRFDPTPQGIWDRLTGLCWGDPTRLPAGSLSWQEARTFVDSLGTKGGPAWRLPGINELESLVDAGRADPALPSELTEKLARGISTEGLWSGTTSGFDPAWAFVLYIQKGAVGVGFKTNRDFAVWPVRSLAP